MFEDDAKLDDILNVLSSPAVREDKNGRRTSDADELRYETKKSFGDDIIKFEFARQMNSGVLK